LGAALLTVSGGGAASDFSVFTVDSGVTATISGLTIAGGNRSASNIGGGVFNAGTLTLAGDVVSGNSAGYGGGVFNAGTAILTGCTLSGNSATASGGGVYSDDGSTLTLINDTITGDKAYYGGGVFSTGVVTLTNATLAADPTTSGGALDNYGAGTVTLNNTIVANRTSGGDIAGTVNGSSNFIDDSATAGGLTQGVNGNIVGVNPLLGTLGNYGGPTQTMPLLPGSPAIDAGSTPLAVDGSGNPLTTDQRGTGFARTLNGMVDIGAFDDQISGTAPGSQNGTQGVSESFTLGSFSDQATPATSWRVDVNWGDGSTGTTLTPTSQGSLGNAGHTYNTAGPETVTVTVSDSYGDVAQYSFPVAVAVAAPALTSIAVAPASPSVAKGLTQQFTATGTYTDGSTANLTSQVTWASATPSVATISSTGLATGMAQGTSVITATLGTVASPGDTLTVTVPLVASVAIVPSVASPTYGQALTFAATVSPASSGGPTPGGTVQFRVDGVNLGPAVNLVKGAATSIATSTLGAGNHTVTAVYSGDNSYAANSGNRGLTVAKAHLTVTASASKVYGAALPTLTPTFSGFVNGDNKTVVSGAPKLTPSATTKSRVGTYPITVAAGTLSASNYDFPNLVNGTLTVSKAQLTVTAVNKTKKQGAANPALTYTIKGFVNRDKPTVVHGKPALSTKAVKKSPAGSYPIIVSLSTLSASNYFFFLVNGTLTVRGAKASAIGVAAARDTATPVHQDSVLVNDGNVSTAGTSAAAELVIHTTVADPSVRASSIVDGLLTPHRRDTLGAWLAALVSFGTEREH